VSGLPVPTTLLVDADGIVRWKDQSKDYMQRSDPEVVRSALRQYRQDATLDAMRDGW
jgi:hypothetical protein